MNGSRRPDLHRVDVLCSDEFCYVIDVLLRRILRDECYDDACKSTAVNTAAAVADLFEEMLGQCQCQCDFLLLIVCDRIAVLQKLPGGTSGFIQHCEKRFPVVLLCCCHGALYAVIFIEVMDGTQDRTIVCHL